MSKNNPVSVVIILTLGLIKTFRNFQMSILIILIIALVKKSLAAIPYMGSPF